MGLLRPGEPSVAGYKVISEHHLVHQTCFSAEHCLSTKSFELEDLSAGHSVSSDAAFRPNDGAESVEGQMTDTRVDASSRFLRRVLERAHDGPHAF